MSASHDSPPQPSKPLWLRRVDQATIAMIAVAALVALAGYWLVHNGPRGEWVEIDKAPPREVSLLIDINRADWSDLLVLPGIGESLARRIVDSRSTEGPFLDHDDLTRVRGIGPKKLAKVKPMLAPIRTVVP